MKKYSIYLFAAAALFATACTSSSDSVDTPTEVTFTTEVTRADVQTELGSGEQMSVYLSSTGTVVSKTATMHLAVCSGGTWKGNPSITLQPNEESYLFAIYPYDQTATNASEFPVTLAAQVDYLYSGTGVSVSYSKPSVALKMRHAMAVLAFDIRSYVGGTLSQIEIGNSTFPTAGTLRVTSGKITPTAYGTYTYACNATLSEQGTAMGQASIFVFPFTVAGTGMDVKMKIGDTQYSCSLPVMSYEGNSKYLFHMNLTESGLSIAGDPEVISLDEAGTALPEESYGRIQVTHSAETFTVTQIAGTDAYGTIYWGDQSSDSYKAGISHTYGSAARYVTSIDLWNATSVTFGSLDGVEEIDFSSF